MLLSWSAQGELQLRLQTEAEARQEAGGTIEKFFVHPKAVCGGGLGKNANN